MQETGIRPWRRKAFIKDYSHMRKTHNILSALLVLMLMGSNMAFSSHVSTHLTFDSGTCVLCTAPGGSGCAITPDYLGIPAAPPELTFNDRYLTTYVLPVILHDHQSRAPPQPSQK